MNIYGLNKLISELEQDKKRFADLLPFYYQMRKDLMKKLSKGIQGIINRDKIKFAEEK